MPDQYSPAVNYLSSHMAQRLKNRELWRKDAGDLLVSHQLALSAVVNCIDRYASKKFEKQNSSMEGRLSLTAQFVQGVDVCETAITEGLYSQAAALLKQEMETIEAVHEFETDLRKDGQTPKLRRLKDFGRIYGQYNNFAHVSVDAIAKLIVQSEQGELNGPSLLPVYNEELAIPFYGMHVFFIVCTAGQIHSVFEEIFGCGINEEEAKWLFLAVEILKKADIIKAVPA